MFFIDLNKPGLVYQVREFGGSLNCNTKETIASYFIQYMDEQGCHPHQMKHDPDLFIDTVDGRSYAKVWCKESIEKWELVTVDVHKRQGHLAEVRFCYSPWDTEFSRVTEWLPCRYEHI